MHENNVVIKKKKVDTPWLGAKCPVFDGDMEQRPARLPAAQSNNLWTCTMAPERQVPYHADTLVLTSCIDA